MEIDSRHLSLLGPFAERFRVEEVLYRDPGFTQLTAWDQTTSQKLRLQVLHKANLAEDPSLSSQWQALRSGEEALWFRPQEWLVEDHWGVLLSWVPPGRFFSELSKTLPDDFYLAWMRQAIKDLAVLHSRGLLHLAQHERSWILFRPDEERGEEVMGISDIGLITEIPLASRVIPQVLVATAPEILLGKEADHRADLYSLACLILRQRSSHRFGHFDTVKKILDLHFKGRMRDLVPESEGTLNQILKRMLAPDPEDRPESLTEVLAMIDPQAASFHKVPVVDKPWVQERIHARANTIILATLTTLMESGEMDTAQTMMERVEGYLQADHEGHLRYLQSCLALRRGEKEGAAEFRRQAKVKLYSRPDPKLKTLLLLEEVRELSQEEASEKKKLLEEAWEVAEEQPDYPLQVRVLSELARWYQEKGDSFRALEEYQRALIRIPPEEISPAGAMVYEAIADFLACAGRPRQAAKYIEWSLVQAEAGSKELYRRHVLTGLIYTALHDWERAREHFSEARLGYSRLGDLADYLWASSHEIRLYLFQREFSRARRELKAIKNRLRARPYHQYLTDFLELKLWLKTGKALGASPEALLERVQGKEALAKDRDFFQDIAWPKSFTAELYEQMSEKMGNFSQASQYAERARQWKEALAKKLDQYGYEEESLPEPVAPHPETQTPAFPLAHAFQVESLLTEESEAKRASVPHPEVMEKIQKLEHHLKEVEQLKSKLFEAVPSEVRATPAAEPRAPSPARTPTPVVLPSNTPPPRPKAVPKSEKDTIVAALKKFQGNKSKAAKELKMHRRTLFEKIKKYQLEDLSFLPDRKEVEEALKSCGGNRSHAAKKLGMSRSSFYRRMKELGLG